MALDVAARGSILLHDYSNCHFNHNYGAILDYKLFLRYIINYATGRSN